MGLLGMEPVIGSGDSRAFQTAISLSSIKVSAAWGTHAAVLVCLQRLQILLFMALKGQGWLCSALDVQPLYIGFTIVVEHKLVCNTHKHLTISATAIENSPAVVQPTRCQCAFHSNNYVFAVRPELLQAKHAATHSSVAVLLQGSLRGQFLLKSLVTGTLCKADVSQVSTCLKKVEQLFCYVGVHQITAGVGRTAQLSNIRASPSIILTITSHISWCFADCLWFNILHRV